MGKLIYTAQREGLPPDLIQELEVSMVKATYKGETRD